MPRLAFLVLPLLILLCGPQPSYAEDAPPAPPTSAEGHALRRLESPVLAERREAVERLVSLLPGSREAVIKALASSSWSVQVQLLEVLGRDGSDAAVRALLRHLVRADEAQAVRIRGMLVLDVKASERLLAAWRKDAKAFGAQAGGGTRGAQRLQELIDLLRRAEIEGKFLARKSKSGSTGYYSGQYDHLKGEGLEAGYRDLALQVVTGIALDEAIPTPGIYKTGIYQFLRPHFVDEWEFQSMALNAVAELCGPDDTDVIIKLEGRLRKLATKRRLMKEALVEAHSLYSYDSKEVQDALFDWDDSLGEYLDQVACLYLVRPDLYRVKVLGFVNDLKSRGWPRPLRPWSYIAGLQIRCGWYQEAIDSYARAMRYGSKAFGYYNQACAYASWSLKKGLSESKQRQHRYAAFRCLQLSVEYGWSDIEWMNEDRDLEPLRKHLLSDYKALVAEIRVKFGFDEDDEDEDDGAGDDKPDEGK